MTSQTAEPLFFPQLLAGRSGAPGALLLRVQAMPALLDDASACVPAWLGDAAFLRLRASATAGATAGAAATAAPAGERRGAQFQFFYPPGLAPAWLAALDAAGWSCLPAGSMAAAPHGLPVLPPPATLWIDGDWCLAAPARSGAGQAASQALALQLVQRVAADATTPEIEALLRQDPLLSYELLRLVNTLGVGGGRRIASFAQAILILGRQQLRRWLNLMLFAARADDTRASMLLARVAVRARLMETLAKARGLDKLSQEQAFMVGMFSLLGVLFGKTLAQLLPPLMLSVAVQQALLEREGELGELLTLVEAAERGQFDILAATLERWQLDAASANGLVLDAHAWMLAVLGKGGTVHG